MASQMEKWLPVPNIGFMFVIITEADLFVLYDV
jgi:hypothetical protein